MNEKVNFFFSIADSDQKRRGRQKYILSGNAEGATLETFEYDGLSRVSKAVDNDSELNFAYDRASRLDWEKSAGKLIDYTYDKLGNLRKIQYPNTRLFERDFDQLNRMNLIKEGSITIAEMKHIGRSYRLLRKQYGNGDLIQYIYDQGRRLTYKETRNKNSDLINHYKYGYNKVHMKTYEQRLHDSGKGNVMDYDALYRLTKMKFNVPDPTIENPTEFDREKTIKFDNLHNILNMVENFNDQIKTITTDIPENSDFSKLNQYAFFDKWGLSYDKNGNTIQRGNQQLFYDFRNQIVTALDAPSNTQVEMKYDVLGRRIQKSVTIGSQTKIENYYYSGHQLIEVRDENDQMLRQHIYGNGIDEIIRMDKFENGTITSFYFQTDVNGSVTAITDADGNLVERVTYDIYGMPTFWDALGNKIPKSSIGNNILFHGREYEYELNLYYFRARYYCPIMGRFLQNDHMGYYDSMNLYQGFNMNPVNFTDPLGLYTDYYWEAKLSRNRKKGQIAPNPAEEMVNAALEQHAKNTAINFGLYAIATEVPVVGPAFVTGYATRQVGEGYIDYLNQRWNDVSVMESGTSRFFKKASSPVMALLDLIGITGGVRSITDDSLSDEERGKLLMNSYNQLSWAAIGGYYGWKQLRNNNEYYLNPNEIDFSQNTAGGRGRYQIIKKSMMEKGWEGDPINVVETPEGFVTIDNTRVVVARDLGMEKIPVNIHKMTDLLPESMIGRFGNATTWGEALIYRVSNQKPILPYTGTKKIPFVKGRK